MNNIDYGPLNKLIGVWKGDKGLDVAPDPEGIENNPYYETITFNAIGNVTNAELQTLAVIHYHQIVQKKKDDEVFHDETGYWIWDAKEKVIMHSFTIPRGVCILAGGNYINNSGKNSEISFTVKSKIDDADWAIIQSPFMQKNAKTIKYHQDIMVTDKMLSYFQVITVDIYGKLFEHTDKNELLRVVE